MTDGELQKISDETPETHEKLAAAVFEVACVAHAHIETARDLAPEVPSEANAALLPAVCVRFVLFIAASMLLDAKQFTNKYACGTASGAEVFTKVGGFCEIWRIL